MKPYDLVAIVGVNISSRRKARGLTQEQLAEMVGIGQQSLSKMENGSIAPRFERLQALANALHCSVADLFRLSEKENSGRAATMVDIIAPLSEESQKAVITVATEMASALKKLEQDGRA